MPLWGKGVRPDHVCGGRCSTAGGNGEIQVKRIAVVTSGGDAPGMNAAVRAVVRTGVARGLAVFGIRHGYEGLIGGQFNQLGPRDVGGIIGHAGTFLGTTRCEG